MSEYVEAEIYETDETLELRWRYNGKRYGILIGQAMFDTLRLADGQQTAILTETLVYDVDDAAEANYFSEDFLL